MIVITLNYGNMLELMGKDSQTIVDDRTVSVHTLVKICCAFESSVKLTPRAFFHLLFNKVYTENGVHFIFEE